MITEKKINNKINRLKKKYCTCHIVGCRTCNLADELKEWLKKNE